MIGGEHYLKLSKANDGFATLFHELSNHSVFYATGRDAIFGIVSHLSPRRLWVPNYLCKSIYDAVTVTGSEIRAYEVDVNLNASMQWLDHVCPGDAVLVLHYFGEVQRQLLDRLDGTGAIRISDATHLLMSPTAWSLALDHSDWVFGSLRKSGPFPDGGFLMSRHARPPEPSMGPRSGFWVKRAAALLSRGASSLFNFMDDENFRLFQEAELELDQDVARPHAMSFLSRGLLESLPLGSSRASVKQNFDILLSAVPGFLIHPISFRAVSPYFPCCFRDQHHRDRVRGRLAEKRMFLPIHWPTSFLDIPHPLSDRILSIPCDGRYQASDMMNVGETLRRLS